MFLNTRSKIHCKLQGILAKSCYVQCFFSFLAVFPLPESYQNDTKIHFNTILRSDTQKSSKNVENTTVFLVSVRNFGLGAKPFLPPPPAKADIATATLTNVIEHLVLLCAPPISTPSPPRRCGRTSKKFIHIAKKWWENSWSTSTFWDPFSDILMGKPAGFRPQIQVKVDDFGVECGRGDHSLWTILAIGGEVPAWCAMGPDLFLAP